MPRKANHDWDDVHFDRGEHAVDLRAAARGYIRDFLGGKPHFRGGAMDPRELYSEQSCRVVLRTPFDDATFLYIHEQCLERIPRKKWYRDVTVSWPVHYLLGLLSELRDRGIPKEMQAGLLLLYFKFCMGFPILPVPGDAPCAGTA